MAVPSVDLAMSPRVMTPSSLSGTYGATLVILRKVFLQKSPRFMIKKTSFALDILFHLCYLIRDRLDLLRTPLGSGALTFLKAQSPKTLRFYKYQFPFVRRQQYEDNIFNSPG